MTTKEEFALENFAQTISTGHMAVAIGDMLAFGEDPADLILRTSIVRQLLELFNWEYGKPEADLELLQKIIFTINTLQNDFRLEGQVVVNETEIYPLQPKKLDLTLNVTHAGNYYKIVQTYADIMPLFNGENEITFYVVADERYANRKTAYKYIPGFTDTPAYIAIDFNDRGAFDLWQDVLVWNDLITWID